MTERNTKINERASELLQQIFNLWTNIGKDKDGDESRRPALEEELITSRKILDEVSELKITDEDVLKYYNDIKEILDEYEEKLAYNKTDNGRAELLLDEIFKMWSIISEEDNIEYRNPADDKEVEQSWALIQEIEEIDFANDAIKERLQTYRQVLETMPTTKQEALPAMNRKNTNRHGKNWERYSIYGVILVLSTGMNFGVLLTKKK